MYTEEMSKEELLEACELNDIKVLAQDTKPILVAKLNEKLGTFDEEEETEEVIVPVKKVRTHRQLGEYKQCIIHPQMQMDSENLIYVGINAYSVNIKPRTEVPLPIGAIEFLKECKYPKHVWDKDAKGIDENSGGGHVTEYRKKFVVEILD